MLLFVYGSMRKGMPNHVRLQNADVATYIGTFVTREQYYMIGLKSKAYPYTTEEQLHPSLQPVQIQGELYEISESLLKSLDVLEGHPDEYMRKPVCIGDGIQAEMYVLENPAVKREIAKAFERGWTRFVSVPDGDWVAHCA
jgi:gamma-glutamylaminecyclotransferase